MKNLSGWQKSLAVTASLSLAVMARPVLSIASNPAIASSNQSSTPGQLSSQNKSEYQLAQAQANCRRVLTRGSDLNVRSTPNGTIVGELKNGTIVTLDSTPSNGWVTISSPTKGYVFDTYLTSCDTPVSTPGTSQTTMMDGNTCRQILSREGVSIRKEASTESVILGSLANGQKVTIINRGANGWVPISAPVNGFVSSSVLIYCR